MREPILKHLVQTGKAGQVVLRSTEYGFVLLLRDGDVEDSLEAKRGHTRHFRKLDTLVGYLRDLGVRSAVLELEAESPGL